MSLVAGIDMSTQSTKIVLCDARTGAIVAQGAAAHPSGTTAPPSAWWDALQAADAAAGGALRRADAVSVAGQQHGLVVLDEDGRVLRDALLWNDTRSAPQARALTAELGGPGAWAARIGLVPVASFTITKLRWLAEHEPHIAQRVSTVMLPHDYLTWRLAGGDPGTEPVTDRGDASGTGYWSPRTGAYDLDLLRLAFGRDLRVPRVAAPSESIGRTAAGAVLGPGTGDNMAAALGLGLSTGDVGVSIGTSGTAFAVSDVPAADATGTVAGFADATGRFLPLVATMNAALVLDAAARLLGVDHAGLSDLAVQAADGSDGLVLLPYLDGERTPDLPDASGSLHGLTRGSMTRANLARSAVEGVLMGLADGIDAIVAQGLEPRRVVLTGGAARSPAVLHAASQVLGLPIHLPVPGEYVALGAARQAAWVLNARDGAAAEPPSWPAFGPVRIEPARPGGASLRAPFAAARRSLYGI